MRLKQIFNGHKDRLINKWEHYVDIYDTIFEKHSGKNITILEIGIYHGGSLQVWKKFLGPKAKIIGIDIDVKCKEFEEENIQIYIGDQKDVNFLNRVANIVGPFDIIIDDGGHFMDEQKVSFKTLFPKMKNTGIYIIEDAHTSYMNDYNGGYLNKYSFIEFSKKLIDEINSQHINSKEFSPDYQAINSIHFYDSLIIIGKLKTKSLNNLYIGKPSYNNLKIYIDTGSGFNEKNTYTAKYNSIDRPIIVNLDKTKKPIHKLRLDPIETKPSLLKIKYIHIKRNENIIVCDYVTNGTLLFDNTYYFETQDPQFIVFNVDENFKSNIKLEIMFDKIETNQMHIFDYVKNFIQSEKNHNQDLAQIIEIKSQLIESHKSKNSKYNQIEKALENNEIYLKETLSKVENFSVNSIDEITAFNQGKTDTIESSNKIILNDIIKNLNSVKDDILAKSNKILELTNTNKFELNNLHKKTYSEILTRLNIDIQNRAKLLESYSINILKANQKFEDNINLNITSNFKQLARNQKDQLIKNNDIKEKILKIIELINTTNTEHESKYKITNDKIVKLIKNSTENLTSINNNTIKEIGKVNELISLTSHTLLNDLSQIRSANQTNNIDISDINNTNKKIERLVDSNNKYLNQFIETQLLKIENQKEIISKYKKLNTELNRTYRIRLKKKVSMFKRKKFYRTIVELKYYLILLFGIVTSFLLSPVQIFRNIKSENFRIFVKALKNEDPKTIYRNIKKKLNKGEIKPIAEKSSITSSGNSINEYSIDKAIILNEKYLILSGWILNTDRLKKIGLFENNTHISNIILTENRNDVYKNYGLTDKKIKLGFSKVLKIEKPLSSLTIRYSTNNNEYSIKIDKIKNAKSEKELSNFDRYQLYIELNTLDKNQINILKSKSLKFKYKPIISIIVPIYNVDPKWLELCINSVKNQIYTNWELCLYDDASTNTKTKQYLKNVKDTDSRIKVKLGSINMHISLASNEAIKMATGEYIALLDNDDEITINALYEVVKALNLNTNLNLIYSDEDKLELDGTRTGPYFKSDFSIDLLRTNNYICHFTVIRKTIGDQFGWFRKGYEGSQDHDVILQVVDRSSYDQIYHIPKILYHWRKIPGSTAETYDDKTYAFDAGKKAIESHLKRNSISAKVKKTKRGGVYRVEYPTEENQSVSIIIPFKDQVQLLKNCLYSIIKFTNYSNYNIILVDNNSSDPKTINFIKNIITKHPHIKYLKYDFEFNYSAINNWAVTNTDSDLILFLNNDTEVIQYNWLKVLASYLQRKDVGAVGCKLLFEDSTIQHAGVVLGVNDVAAHIFHGLHSEEIHHFSYGVTKNMSACTAACLLTDRKLFIKLQGFDENNLKIAFNDIDYCLKVRKEGLLVVYTPDVSLYHFESKSRGYEDTPEKVERFNNEINYFKNKWSNYYENGDPYYNQNLTKTDSNYLIQFNE